MNVGCVYGCIGMYKCRRLGLERLGWRREWEGDTAQSHIVTTHRTNTPRP
jgi:hypothetical protein